MTKKRNIWIYPFILMGMLSMLTNSCNKDGTINVQTLYEIKPDIIKIK